MASAEPLLQDSQQDTRAAPTSRPWSARIREFLRLAPAEEHATPKPWYVTLLREIGYVAGALFAIAFILAWIVQFAIFWWATSFSGCSAGSLRGYNFPGGGHSEKGNASFNILPQVELLAERKPAWFGEGFDVIPATDASTPSDAPTGTWWRIWGPYFYTYTYEDVANSQTTAYMRANLLRMGMSHKIVRCDSSGPTFWVSEGGNYITNRIRHLFGMNQGYSFQVHADDDLVAIIEEKNTGYPSMIFRSVETSDTVATSILTTRTFHGSFDEWLVKSDPASPIPFYVPSATTLLLAFHLVLQEKRSEASKASKASATDNLALPQEISTQVLPGATQNVDLSDVWGSTVDTLSGALHDEINAEEAKAAELKGSVASVATATADALGSAEAAIQDKI